MGFRSPSIDCRPAPFWSWNDALAEDELRWQIQQFKAAGFGGFFMHSRVGLETEYLSDEWFTKIGACIDEARRIGMLAWLYDEDKWASGFAGGWLNRRFPETRGVGLAAAAIQKGELDKALAAPETLAVFAIDKDAHGTVRSSRRLKTGDVPTDGEIIWHCYARPFANDNWFNGETYLDILNPQAVEKFLDLTIDGYDKRFRNDFGRTVPGIFTDEPNFYPWVGADLTAMPWTAGMGDLFKKRFGYDLLDRLDALAFRCPGFQKVRHDYHRFLTERFVESFAKPYGELCGRLGLKLTGHWLWEDSLRSQVMHIGAAMPHYEYEQVPGIDHLRRNIEDALTLKQAASVAHQFGRDQVLCEIFGVSGQDFSFEDAKWIGDFHLALGVNYFCPHLTLYSFTGDRKRDYPPTFSYHQPYWDRMSFINDYFARAGWVTRQGEFQTKILVLHPIASAWAFVSRFDDCPEADFYHQELVSLQSGLLGRHLDYDYGDEMILARHGRVEGRNLRVASHGVYEVVLVPPSLTWTCETVTLLEKLLSAGGRVVFVGQLPTSIDGEPRGDRWAPLHGHANARRVPNEAQAVAEALEEMELREISVTGADGREIESILCHHRRSGDKNVYFICNTSRQTAYETRIALNAGGSPLCCDMVSGDMRPIPAHVSEGRLILSHRFEPVGSLAIMVDPQQSLVGRTADHRETAREILQGNWSFARTHPNTLVLDTCRWAINDGPLSEPSPVWKVRRAAFDAAGLQEYRGIQPWVLKQKGIVPSKTAKVEMRFSFKSEIDQPNVFLVVELAENFHIRLNGHEIPADRSQWQWDKKFRKIPVGSQIRKGSNELLLTAIYRPGVEIEDIFIVGDFATRRVGENSYVIVPEPDRLTIGDWGPQGYHFYSGNMVYRRTIRCARRPGQRTVLRLNQPAGTLFEVRVNNQTVGLLGWHPWELDITEFLGGENNDLEIVVYGSLRNTFGPLHNKQYLEKGNNWWIGPEAFTDEANWTDRYVFAPYGLLGGAELITFE
ncbi:MAG: glycosyl hydrolase [Phycisphaerae bacterium]